MKTRITTTLKHVATDRTFIVAFAILTVLVIIFCLFVGFGIRVSELQVVTHYTAFGSTNFYRDRWYYLLTFIAFGIVTLVLYGAIACKLFVQKGRELAIPFLWLGCAIVLIAFAVVSQVMRLASFS